MITIFLPQPTEYQMISICSLQSVPWLLPIFKLYAKNLSKSLDTHVSSGFSKWKCMKNCITFKLFRTKRFLKKEASHPYKIRWKPFQNRIQFLTHIRQFHEIIRKLINIFVGFKWKVILLRNFLWPKCKHTS